MFINSSKYSGVVQCDTLISNSVISALKRAAQETFGEKMKPHITQWTARLRRYGASVDLISDVLLFGRLWYDGPGAVSHAIGYARHYSRSHDAVIRVYDEAGNVIETHEYAGDFKEWWCDQNVCDYRIRGTSESERGHEIIGDGDTTAKYLCNPVRLAPAQKGTHQCSRPAASKRCQRWQRCYGRIETHHRRH